MLRSIPPSGPSSTLCKKAAPMNWTDRALAANALMDCCAAAVSGVLADARLKSSDIAAIGLHGQTVRHRPELQFTIQLANPARLAEACRIAVVADFRSRDIAAGGQGAPLAPALHAALFRDARAAPRRSQYRRHREHHRPAAGWTRARLRHRTGQHAARRLVHAAPRRGVRPRRRMGGDLAGRSRHCSRRSRPIHISRCRRRRAPGAIVQSALGGVAPAIVICAGRRAAKHCSSLTAATIAAAIAAHCAGRRRCWYAAAARTTARCCGSSLAMLRERALATTAAYGVPVGDVEALAFAWLARESLAGGRAICRR